MTSARARVRELAAKGALAGRDAEALMAALEGVAAGPRGPRVLFDPFQRYGGGVAAAVGLVIVALELAFTRIGVRYDGFLDVHRAAGPTSLVAALGDLVAGVLLPTLVAWAISHAFARQGRLLDHFGVVTVARVGGLVAAPAAWLGTPEALAASPVRLTVICVLALTSIAWSIVLFTRGFANASGLSGARLATAVTIAIVVAEVASKVGIAFGL